MRFLGGLDDFTPDSRPVAVTIGNFDGVHRGHQRLLALCKAGVSGELATVAVTFEPHPATVLTPDRSPPRLTTPAEKLALLDHYGVTGVVVLESRPELFAQTPLEFLQRLTQSLRPHRIVVGGGFRFGRGRSGSTETLRQHATALHYELVIADDVHDDGSAGDELISSTVVRSALRDGRVEAAAALLGRWHRITGAVGHGQQRGAALGFATANLEQISQLAPGLGVYAAYAQLDDADRTTLHPAVVNVGPQPTFGQDAVRTEAHLLDFSGNLRGQRIGLHFVARLRGQQKFADGAALAQQIALDVSSARHVLATSAARSQVLALPLSPPFFS